MEERIILRIKGSAAEPYRVTAEGRGEALRIYCTCPAGDRAGRFCKHVAAVLLGDVTNLVDGLDRVGELAARAQGSELLLRAMVHVPKSARNGIPVSNSGVLADDLRDVLDECAAMGWVVMIGPDYVGLGKPLKSGGIPKIVKIKLKHTPASGRPYRVDAPNDGGAKTFGLLGSAAAAFRAAAAARLKLLA